MLLHARFHLCKVRLSGFIVFIAANESDLSAHLECVGLSRQCEIVAVIKKFLKKSVLQKVYVVQ